MTPLREIVKALKEISEWPWIVDIDPRQDMDWNMEILSSECNPIGDRLTVAFMANKSWKNLPKWQANARSISSSPLWLAELVVRVVEERASMLEIRCELDTGTSSGVDRYINDALSDPDINITPKDFAWLKGKVGG